MLEQITRDNIKIGTTIYVVHPFTRHKAAETVTITKVGRKWAYYGNRDDKINLETMRATKDYRGIEPQLYDNKESYLDCVNRQKTIYLAREKAKQIDDYDLAVKILSLINNKEY